MKCAGLARERGGVGPCGEEFSAGLIFLYFITFLLQFKKVTKKNRRCASFG